MINALRKAKQPKKFSPIRSYLSSNEGGKGGKHGDKWEKNSPGRHKNKHKSLEVGECLTNEIKGD